MPSNEIRVMYQAVALFSYDESRVRFKVVFDAEGNEVRMTSGRHGYSVLVESCAMGAVTTDPMEHNYWDTGSASTVDNLTTIMNPRL